MKVLYNILNEFCIPVKNSKAHTRYDQEKTGLSAQRLNQWTEHTATSGDD